MANCRNRSGFLTYALPAAVIAAIVYGGTLLSGQDYAPQPAVEQVVEVRVQGNGTVPTATILKQIHSRCGRPFDSDVVSDDVRRLSRTRLFVNVDTFVQQVPGGRIVEFRVVERPTLQRVVFVGNAKIKSKVLLKQIDLKVGDALDPFAVTAARTKIEDYYRSKGYNRVYVSIREGDEAGHRQAIFVINEGQKQKIAWTGFVGNTIAGDARLRTQIESKPPRLYIFGGEVDRRQIEADEKRLAAYYHGLGFFGAEVGHIMEPWTDNGWMKLTFVISEGPRYNVRSVEIRGNEKYSTQELLAELELKANQHFDRKKMTTDVAALRDKYGSVGYIGANVQPDIRFDEQPGNVDLVYDITEGDRWRVGRINVVIKGEYPHTRRTAVLDRISLSPGDIVDIRKLRESERRLQRSGLFESNPATGMAPKIVFSLPPADELETQIARPPRRGPDVRGQSPDLVPCGGWEWTPSPESRPGDRRVDLQLPCSQAGQQPPAAASPPQTYLAPPQPAPVRPVPSPTSHIRWLQPPASKVIVRGQGGYDTEGGWSVPQHRPRVPAPIGASQFDVRPNPPLTEVAPQGHATPPAFGAGSNYQAAPPSGFNAAQPTTIRPTIIQPTTIRPMPTHAAPNAPGAIRPGPPYASGVPAAVPPGEVSGSVGRIGAAVGDPTIAQHIRPNESLLRDDHTWIGTDPMAEEPIRILPLDVIANETQTGRLSVGVGVNSDAGLMGTIMIDERNFDITRCPDSWADIRNATAFRGDGQQFRIEAVPGTRVQRYMFTFRDPFLGPTNIMFGLSGFLFDRRYREWDEQRLGGSVTLGYQFTPDLSGSATIRAANVNIHDPAVPTPADLTAVLGDNSLYGFKMQISHDTRDSAFLATEGHLIKASFEQVLGTYDYPRAEVDLRRYFHWGGRTDGSGRNVLALTGRVGYTGTHTPIYDHYFAGGYATLRGFDYRGVSPIDGPTGGRIGGEAQILASAQFMRPLTADDMLWAAFFCDVGTVLPTIDDWDHAFRVAPGFGLRIKMPRMSPAPIAFDFAFPITLEDRDRLEVFSFFMGFSR